MGAAQSMESGGRPRITETANFDFRYEPSTRVTNWGEIRTSEGSSSRSSFDTWNQMDGVQRNREHRSTTGSANYWSDSRNSASYWLESGVDAVKKYENGCDRRQLKFCEMRA